MKRELFVIMTHILETEFMKNALSTSTSQKSFSFILRVVKPCTLRSLLSTSPMYLPQIKCLFRSTASPYGNGAVQGGPSNNKKKHDEGQSEKKWLKTIGL